MRRPGRAAVAAAAVLVLSLAAGCSNGLGEATRQVASLRPSSATSRSSSPATSASPSSTATASPSSTANLKGGVAVGPVPPGLDALYAQTILWQPCRNWPDAECADLLVPITHDGESMQRGSVPMYRLASTGDAPAGTLVVSLGAIGLQVETLLDDPDNMVPERLREAYDLVFITPRAAASPWWLNCDGTLLDQVAMADPTPVSADQSDRQRQAVLAVVKECLELDAAALSPRESAGDVDILRSVLGTKKVKLYATAYSSIVALEYLQRYPGNLGALVIDGAHDTRRPEPQTATAYARAMELATMGFIRHCVKSSTCPLGQDPRVAVRRLADFLDGLDSKPLDTGDAGVPKLGEGAVRTVISSWYDFDHVTAALQQAMTSRRGSLLLDLWKQSTGRLKNGQYDDNSPLIGAIISSCVDYAPSSVTAARAAALADQLRATYPMWGAAAAWGSRGGNPMLGLALTAGCPGWTGPSAATTPAGSARGLGASAVPVLVIDNGDSDEGPGVFTQAAVSRLAHPGVLKLYGSYLALLDGSDCVWDKILRYLNGAGLPPANAACG